MVNGYRELNSYEEPCISVNGKAIISFAREFNPTGVGEHLHMLYCHLLHHNDTIIKTDTGRLL